MNGSRLWNRLAAATGIDFFAVGVAIAVMAQANDIENSHDWIAKSDGVWGAYNLLVGLSAILFLWFTSIFASRIRQVEDASGTSGRLGNAVLASGAVFAGALATSIAAQWAARMLGVDDLAQLSTAILEGPPLGFIIATYIGAAGLAVFRAGPTVAPPSRIVAMASLVIAPAYVVVAAVQLFKNYAWIDETGYIVFLVWVLAVSVIGVQRWADIDEGWTPGSDAPQGASADRRDEPEPLVPLAYEGPEPLESTVEITATRSAAARKPAARKKPAPRKKPATRKPSARKPSARDD